MGRIGIGIGIEDREENDPDIKDVLARLRLPMNANVAQVQMAVTDPERTKDLLTGDTAILASHFKTEITLPDDYELGNKADKLTRATQADVARLLNDMDRRNYAIITAARRAGQPDGGKRSDRLVASLRRLSAGTTPVSEQGNRRKDKLVEALKNLGR